MSGLIEEPVVFTCAGESLFGLLHSPSCVKSDTGVLIVVGGPQYRVGSHRQFVELARGLAQEGISVFRFDYRGMGDSTGEFKGFEQLDLDIRSAIDAFLDKTPSIRKLVIWGLCDGASAACFYAPNDNRVTGLCLVNPWARTEQGEAEAFVKHYYLSRILSKDLWQKLFSGELQVFNALEGLLENIRRSFFGAKDNQSDSGANKEDVEKLPLPVKLFRDLTAYTGKLMFIISGNDLTAAEFMDSVGKHNELKKLMASSRVNMVYLPEADHTFSRRTWMDEVISQTATWVKSV